MKLTAQIQILPDMEQKQRLLATMEHFNQADSTTTARIVAMNVLLSVGYASLTTTRTQR